VRTNLLAPLFVLAIVSSPSFANQLNLSKIFRNIESLHYLIENGLLQTIVAKELCSCLYITKLPKVSQCQDLNRGSLPSVIFSAITIDVDSVRSEIRVAPRFHPTGGKVATARFLTQTPQFGCQVDLR
jgi:hypothetical protein